MTPGRAARLAAAAAIVAAASASIGALGAMAVEAVRARLAPPHDEEPTPTGGASGVTNVEADADAGASAGEDATAAPPPRRVADQTFNVILITIDTLRWDLGFTGYPRPITPNLDKLAERGVVYERAYATASYTPKSIGPMLIGRYASETFRDGEHYTTFYPANVFLAERLHDAGQRTLAATCHHYFKWKTGLDQGFDVWDTSAMPPAMVDNDPSITSDKLSDAAIELLSKADNVTPGDGRRFFAWFHYMDPHLPYVPHEDAPDLVGAAPDAGPPERALYDQEVWFTDAQVGRVLDHVAAQPWADSTAIIVTADHGESFGEHGLRGHGRELWESVVRVPLVVYVPSAAPRRIADVKRSHIDLAPTILELMGAPPPEAGALRGKSLVADLDAETDTPLEDRDALMDMPSGPFNEMRRALVTDGTPGIKIIDFGGRYELYDLAADPLETRTINGDVPRLRTATDRLRRALAELAEARPAP